MLETAASGWESANRKPLLSRGGVDARSRESCEAHQLAQTGWCGPEIGFLYQPPRRFEASPSAKRRVPYFTANPALGSNFFPSDVLTALIQIAAGSPFLIGFPVILSFVPVLKSLGLIPARAATCSGPSASNPHVDDLPILILNIHHSHECGFVSSHFFTTPSTVIVFSVIEHGARMMRQGSAPSSATRPDHQNECEASRALHCLPFCFSSEKFKFLNAVVPSLVWNTLLLGFSPQSQYRMRRSGSLSFR